MQFFKNPRMPSNQSHDFSRVPKAQIERSSFRRPATWKTTFDAGKLVPIFVDEVLPGDTFNLKLQTLMRLATPLFPCMDNLVADFFFFFVPNRLVWDNWEKFCGAQDKPTDSVDFIIPQCVTSGAGGFTENSVFDYFGLPTKVDTIAINALPLRAYNLIYNTWFRDENLIDSVPVNTDDGPDSASDYVLLNRAKRHDYFTSCLPWPQKGDDILLPLGESVPVTTSDTDVMTGAHTGMRMRTKWGNYAGGNQLTAVGSDGYLRNTPGGPAGVFDPMYPSNLIADLSLATGTTVNAFREAIQLQRILERDARGGTRYVEHLLAHWGVTSPDFRLQNPEYLGGGSVNINIAPVPQTSATDGTAVKGSLGGVGMATGRVGFNKSFVEHGYIIGLVSVRADLTYQQGLHKMWSRSTRYDFYMPALAHLGEQAVLNKEIYYQGDGNTHDEQVFGYQERWAEYRYGQSRITGLFRSNAATSLDAWHLSQEFGSLPTLGQDFIEENPPVDRIIAVPSEPHIIYDSFIDLTCARPMPVYSVPGLVDHF